MWKKLYKESNESELSADMARTLNSILPNGQRPKSTLEEIFNSIYKSIGYGNKHTSYTFFTKNEIEIDDIIAKLKELGYKVKTEIDERRMGFNVYMEIHW